MKTDLKNTEARRLQLQSELDARRTAGDRNRLGQYSTPPWLARQIARFVRERIDPRPASIRFCDPAVGSGAFFYAFRAEFPKRCVAAAQGVEIDAEFSAAARNLWTEHGLAVVEGDFARLIAGGLLPARPNLILANPPYVRHHHLDRETKLLLQGLARNMTGLTVNGLAGLYVYFFLIATAWLEPDGIAAWLVPSEFMDVNYGEVVKRFLTELVTPIRIHRFDAAEAQFDDALVSSAVVVVRNRRPPTGVLAEFSTGGTLLEPASMFEVTIEELAKARKWTAYHLGQLAHSSAVSTEGGVTVGDLFEIKRGIATGCDEVFILAREDVRRLDLPGECVRPIMPSPRHLRDTIIEADRDGYPRIENQLAVIDCSLPEFFVREKYPELWQYMCEVDRRGLRDRYLLRKRQPWYKLETRPPAPFLCTYMGRSGANKKPFRFIWNKSQATATNLYLLMYPRAALTELLKRRPENAESVFGFLSDITSDDLRRAGRVYGGGLHKLEPNELGAISAQALVERFPELAGHPVQASLF